VLDELDPLVVGEALMCRLEHGLGEVKADTKHLRATNSEQSEQATVARAEVEDPTSVARHVLEQDAVSVSTTWIPIRPAKIAADVLGVGPLLRGHPTHGTLVSPSRTARRVRHEAQRMRLPNTAHTSGPWRIHELTRDFRLEDVWALPTPGGPDDFPRLV
jgi:hypothetical protein